LVLSQIWKLEIEAWLELHNLHIDYVTIQSKLKYLIPEKVAEPVKWNHSPGSTRPRNHWFKSSPGNNPWLIAWFGLLHGCWPGLGHSVRFQPWPKPGNLEPLLTLGSAIR
jgi:hypothetical protein